MTAVLVSLVILAGLSLGLRTTSVLMPPSVHPLDRLALSIAAGALLTAVMFELAGSYGLFDFALGLMLSLSPVGLFDAARWWFRSRGRRGQWLGGAPPLAIGVRWLFLVSLIAAIAAGVAFFTSDARPDSQASSSPGAPAAPPFPSSRS